MASRIPYRGYTTSLARSQMIRGDVFQLQFLGGFDHGDLEAGLNVPLDVAVEEPNARVIGAKPYDQVRVLVGHDGVSAQGEVGDGGWVALEGTGFRVGALDDLEFVPVQMPGVQVVLVVVEEDFHDFVFLEDEWIAVDAVYGGVGYVLF